MKRLFIPSLLGLLLICPIYLSAQKKERIIHLQNREKKPIQFGYYLGLNKKGFEIKYNNDISTSGLNNDLISVQENFGFNIGLTLQYRLNDNLGLRFEPGLSSNTKTLKYNPVIIPDNQLQGNVREISGTYLRFPLLLKLSTNRIDNMRAFVIAGVSYDYNFSSNENNVDDNFSAGQFRMKTNNFMYEVGIGVDIYLYFFKFSPSIRGIFAINNEIVPDNFATSPYTAPVKYFGTRGVFLNLTFE